MINSFNAIFCILLTVFQIAKMTLMLGDVTACLQTCEHFIVCISLLGLRLLHGCSENAQRLFGDSWRSEISTRRHSDSSRSIWHSPEDQPLPQASVCQHFKKNSVIAVLHHFQVNIFAAITFSLVNILGRRFAPWTWIATPILTSSSCPPPCLWTRTEREEFMFAPCLVW